MRMTLFMGVLVSMIFFMVMRVALFVVMLGLLSESMCMAVTLSVFMPSAAHHSPNEEEDAGQNQHSPDNMALLGINRLLKLQTNHRDNPSQHERGDHMSEGCQKSDPSHMQETPPLRPRNDGQGNPVIR